jgi:formate dehydrogenase maturation protein FdhE
MADFMKAPRSFKDGEMKRIAYFLLAHHRAKADTEAVATEQPDVETLEAQAPVNANGNGKTTRPVSCKKCSSTNLAPMIGRYGPYMKCADCEENTSVRVSCKTCETRVKLAIEGLAFVGSCDACGNSFEITAV